MNLLCFIIIMDICVSQIQTDSIEKSPEEIEFLLLNDQSKFNCVTTRKLCSYDDSRGWLEYMNCMSLQPIIECKPKCLLLNCVKNPVCQFGFKLDNNGCHICECISPCEMVVCPHGYKCVFENKQITSSSVFRCEPSNLTISQQQAFSLVKNNKTIKNERPCDCHFPTSDKWQVFQRRCNGLVDFYRNYENYSIGFGNELGEFWKGNNWLTYMTNGPINYKLRIDLEDFNGTYAWAEYALFNVASLSEGYRLTVGTYSGTAGDSLSSHNSKLFYAYDHDTPKNLCARTYKGAWWYGECHSSNLNGKYLNGSTTSYATGVVWQTFRDYYYSLKCTEMKISPV